MNNLTITGRLVRDPELRFSAGGTAVCTGAFAWEDMYLKKKEDANATSFFDFVMFGKTAENFNKYFSKGDPIQFVGSISQGRWEDKETGAKRSKVVLKIFSWDFPAKPRNKDNDQPESKPDYKAGGPHPVVDESEIPFAPRGFDGSLGIV